MKIKKMVLLAILFTFVSVSDVLCQKVLATMNDGCPVIDCSGMPEKSVKTPAEVKGSKTTGGRTRRHKVTSDITTSTLTTPNDNGSNASDATTKGINNKVSPKFAVAPADANGGRMTWAAASGWHTDANYEDTGASATASTGCAAYSNGSHGVGSWRLPTQRELILIYRFKDKLKSVGGVAFDLLSSSYLSATEDGGRYSYYLAFDTGVVNENYKTQESSLTRCVRDI